MRSWRRREGSLPSGTTATSSTEADAAYDVVQAIRVYDKGAMMAEPLDSMARAIFTAALTEDRCGELLKCLFDGGSATVDAKTSLLVLCPASTLAAMSGSQECSCTTAADLGFSGWGDGVNPNMIANADPDCPVHGGDGDVSE